jgi:hypothetical protein
MQMDKLLEFFNSNNTQILAVFITGFTTIFAALISGYATFQAEKLKSKSEKEILKTNNAVQDNETLSLEQRKRGHLKTRMNEVTFSVQRYNREATVQRWSNNFLVFGQYVVGVALTSSFLQQSLTPTWIGILGLIVLLTTVIHQRFRPDAKKKIAEAKVVLLQTTIRNAQDELALNDTPPVEKIIKRITRTLNRVEIEESDEWISQELASEAEKQEEVIVPTIS